MTTPSVRSSSAAWHVDVVSARAARGGPALMGAPHVTLVAHVRDAEGASVRGLGADTFIVSAVAVSRDQGGSLLRLPIEAVNEVAPGVYMLILRPSDRIQETSFACLLEVRSAETPARASRALTRIDT